MFDILTYKFELRKLQWQKEKNRKYFQKCRDEARKVRKSNDEIDGLISEEMAIRDRIDDDIAQMQYRLLVRQAERYLIPTPKHITQDGTWEQSEETGRWRLSQGTLSELKKAIHHEQKYRREYWQGWLALLVGLIGALTGLLAVWKSN